MNGMDVALVVLLLLCALRGFWRGFFRESFGFAGFVLALAAALRFADAGAQLLAERLPASIELPATARSGVAFVAIFIAVQSVLNLLGLLIDRMVGSLFLRRASRVGGALFGLAKGGAVLAFLLLFLHVFPVVPGIDQRIMESRVAHPLVSMAGSVVRAGLPAPADPERGGKA
jgi:membrane protein required for colicin V production